MGGSEGSQSVLTAPGRYSPNFQPASHVITQTREPLCGDPEGWGPISELRWDLTPCFLDVWIVGVTVWGVLFGAGALVYLFKKRVAQDVPKDWHFYAKL